jgi:glycosyltransferase involved in cell wall biosynthesis
MRILMLGSKEYPFGFSARYDPKAGGGIEMHVEKLSKYLARRGHDVYIITRRFPGQPPKEDLGRIHVIRTRYIPNRYLRAFTFNLLAYLKAMRLVRGEGIDVIHCHAVISGFFGAKLSKATRRPMVFTPHGIDVALRFPFHEAVRFMLKVSLWGASRILFISRFARDYLKPRLRKPHALLSNAIDMEDYDFKPSRSGDVRFLFLGRLESLKGVDTLIGAFPEVLERCPGARLMVAGEGSLKERIVDLILKTGSDRIRYMGWMETREALKDSDVFVLPSKETGQPLALLEAMAAGKIVITTLPFIKPGRTGLSCRFGDKKGLAKRMIQVCRNFRGYQKLGKHAREYVRKLTWESQAELFEREYEKALGM